MAVSCEPMFCFLFCINIPLVLLMGKKLNTNFLALSQKLSMPLDSDIGIFYRQKRMYSTGARSAEKITRVPSPLLQLRRFTEPAVPAPHFPSPLWHLSPSSWFPHADSMCCLFSSCAQARAPWFG